MPLLDIENLASCLRSQGSVAHIHDRRFYADIGFLSWSALAAQHEGWYSFQLDRPSFMTLCTSFTYIALLEKCIARLERPLGFFSGILHVSVLVPGYSFPRGVSHPPVQAASLVGSALLCRLRNTLLHPSCRPLFFDNQNNISDTNARPLRLLQLHKLQLRDRRSHPRFAETGGYKASAV